MTHLHRNMFQGTPPQALRALANMLDDAGRTGEMDPAQHYLMALHCQRLCGELVEILRRDFPQLRHVDVTGYAGEATGATPQ